MQLQWLCISYPRLSKLPISYTHSLDPHFFQKLSSPLHLSASIRVYCFTMIWSCSGQGDQYLGCNWLSCSQLDLFVCVWSASSKCKPRFDWNAGETPPISPTLERIPVQVYPYSGTIYDTFLAVRCNNNSRISVFSMNSKILGLHEQKMEWLNRIGGGKGCWNEAELVGIGSVLMQGIYWWYQNKHTICTCDFQRNIEDMTQFDSEVEYNTFELIEKDDFIVFPHI